MLRQKIIVFVRRNKQVTELLVTHIKYRPLKHFTALETRGLTTVTIPNSPDSQSPPTSHNKDNSSFSTEGVRLSPA